MRIFAKNLFKGILALVAAVIIFNVSGLCANAQEVREIKLNEVASIQLLSVEDTYGYGIVTISDEANAEVIGDGIALRREPSLSADILERLYDGELVRVDFSKHNNDWVYLKRLKTGTWGWAAQEYIYWWD